MLTVLPPADSHSMIVRIFRAETGLARWRWVRRAFFRWWKSPSVRVYLGKKMSHSLIHQFTQ